MNVLVNRLYLIDYNIEIFFEISPGIEAKMKSPKIPTLFVTVLNQIIMYALQPIKSVVL